MSLFESLQFWKKKDYEQDPNSQLSIDRCRFVVLDTETTGFDYDNDRILCIGALVLQNGSIDIQQTFEHYIDQDHYDTTSAQIHGILRSEVLNHKTEKQVLELFLDYLGDSIIVAHHAIFDVTMINRALERNGLPILQNKRLDTAILYKKTLIQSHLFERKEHYSLDDLADKFDISKKDRHTALGDALITAVCFLKIIKKFKEDKKVELVSDVFRL